MYLPSFMLKDAFLQCRKEKERTLASHIANINFMQYENNKNEVNIFKQIAAFYKSTDGRRCCGSPSKKEPFLIHSFSILAISLAL